MASFLLCHRHTPDECPVAFAAWKGFSSPLRHEPVLSSCPSGDHQCWWQVEAPSAGDALELLPRYVAARTTAVEVGRAPVP